MLSRKAVNALRIKLALAELAREKSITLEKLKKSTLKLKIDHDSKKQSTSKWRKVVARIKNTPLFQEGAYPKEVLQNFFWFLLGSTFNIFIYFVFVYQLKIRAFIACLICLSVGSICSIGMPHSKTLRCVILLSIPGFFASKGRTFLVMYAFIIAVNEPMMNFNHNTMVMTSAITCGQEMSNNQTEKLLSTALDPFSGILGGIEKFVAKVNYFSRMTQQAFLSMKRGMEELVASINGIFSWLGNMVNVCNDEMLGPYNKCMGAFKVAFENCVDSLGIIDFICGIVKDIKPICNIVRILELLCTITKVIKGFLRETFAVPIRNAVRNLHDMFYFKVIVSHVYQTSIEQTKTYSQVRDDVLRQVRQKLSVSMMKMQLLGLLTGFAFSFIFMKAVYYRLKYVSQNKFDNFYLSKMFYQIDKKRMLEGKRTLLPLKKSEKKKYIDLFTLRLSSREKNKIIIGIVFLSVSSLTIGFYLLFDYGLYWILDLVRRCYSVKIDKESISRLKLQVRGEGPYADMFRSMVSVFDTLEDDDAFENSKACLPSPNEPNFVVYYTIGFILSICFLSVLFEAYGLRLKHIICGHIYAQRANERTHWLYFNMLLSRTFMKQKMRSNYRGHFDTKKISWRSKVASRFPIFKRLLKVLRMDVKFCIGCNIQGDIDDRLNFEHCENEVCGAVYCLDCYYDIHNTCTVCMKPVDYGDFYDVDEERDSSDDAVESHSAVEKRKERISSKSKQPKKKDEKEDELLMQRVFEMLGVDQNLTNYGLEPNNQNDYTNASRSGF